MFNVTLKCVAQSLSQLVISHAAVAGAEERALEY